MKIINERVYVAVSAVLLASTIILAVGSTAIMGCSKTMDGFESIKTGSELEDYLSSDCLGLITLTASAIDFVYLPIWVIWGILTVMMCFKVFGGKKENAKRKKTGGKKKRK